ncbi:MAG: NMD3-related protein, partial [Candidatus Micrarchaeota archaeon]
MERICPICGGSSEKKKFAGEFCLECVLERKKEKLPTKVNIIICAGCGKIKNKGKWERRSDKLIEEIAVKAFRKSGFEG